MQPVALDLEDASRRSSFRSSSARASAASRSTIKRVAYMRYYGQLDDVEVESPVAKLETAADLQKLLDAFEDLYTKMFTLAAQAGPRRPTTSPRSA